MCPYFANFIFRKALTLARIYQAYTVCKNTIKFKVDEPPVQLNYFSAHGIIDVWLQTGHPWPVLRIAVSFNAY